MLLQQQKQVAWMTFPLGILVTLGACVFVFWLQGLSYSSPYAQAILINDCCCRLGNNIGYDRPLANMCGIFTLQSIRKLILQEGEKMVLVCMQVWVLFTISLTLLDQNSKSYQVDLSGSLVVRLVFLPFEESSYATFARNIRLFTCLLVDNPHPSRIPDANILIHYPIFKLNRIYKICVIGNSDGNNEEKKKKLEKHLTDALKLVLLIGLVVIAFGPSYSYSLIRVLYGRKWSDGEASTALQYYCFYVIVLAMNGTSEAFLPAVATENQLKQSNDLLLVFSLIYIVLNILLIRSAGAIGLILANSLIILYKLLYL
ncbi:hypothetical protein CDL12_22664 [Handroanthus impetiginosus]|uniref:Protein RFT1 homolog n=1 Tax=Handroanthus impetiginosus TaxID=429701 RepID=A0A2G9GIG1_9LAMI|nr:hypothetical protein CDL12_22664 [Handroanthus impetiginosus]